MEMTRGTRYRLIPFLNLGLIFNSLFPKKIIKINFMAQIDTTNLIFYIFSVFTGYFLNHILI